MRLTCVKFLPSAAMAVIGFAVVAATLTTSGQDSGRSASIAGTAMEIDASLILRTWRLKGVMFCPKPCLFVENAYPAGILEAARQPFRMGPVQVKGLTEVASSSHTESSDGSGSTLQFSESHVYTFIPPVNLDLVLAVPKGDAFAVNYLSELDGLGWRAGIPDQFLFARESAILCDLKPRDAACAGRWGNFYPRTGFVVRDSEVISSYLTALRGGRVASSPWGRVVLKPYPFEPRVGHYIQMVRPAAKAPVAIGSGEVFSAESRSGSKDGYYAFLHYGIFEACGKCLPARLVGPRPVK